jgi:uncharacterized coiled-coil protein SlyX
MDTREFVHGDKPGNALPTHDPVVATERHELAAKTGQDRTRRGKLESRLAEYRDALTGMAAQVQEHEKRIRRHEVEKAELAARIADLDQHNAALKGYLQEAAVAGKVLLGEVRRQRDVERDCGVALRKQAETSERSVLECQQQKAGAARPEDALVAAEVEWTRNGSLLVSLEGDKGMQHPLYKPVMVIGRSCEANIRVDGPRTSRWHTRVLRGWLRLAPAPR